MKSEIVGFVGNIDAKNSDLFGAISRLLPRGHVLHGYSSTSSERVFKILDERDYSDDAAMLGFGVDGTAERAMARALLTYAMRERDGLDVVEPGHYPEMDQAQTRAPGGAHSSRFDNIVWGGNFTLYQEGDVVVARSSFGGGAIGMSSTDASGEHALEAIQELVTKYKWLGPALQNSMERLPVIAL